MEKLGRKLTAAACGVLLMATTLVACGGPGSDDAKNTGNPGAVPSVALLFPGTEPARNKALDIPLFEARIKALGDFDVLHSDAGKDASAQVKQAEIALADGAGVLVLDPVDSKATEDIVAAAAEKDVPVISYDSIETGSTGLAYRISFDHEQIGVLQANSLIQKLRSDGVVNPGILVVNGPAEDPEAELVAKGARSVIDKSAVKILAELDANPAQVQDWTAKRIAEFPGRIDGIYAAKDSLAGGAVAALSSAAMRPWPLVTGQDAQLEGIRRIITGRQYMSIYKPVRAEAELAATVAAKLARGQAPPPATKVAGVPTRLLIPKVVTRSNIMDTVVSDGVYTVEEICTAKYAKACAAANIQ